MYSNKPWQNIEVLLRQYFYGMQTNNEADVVSWRQLMNTEVRRVNFKEVSLLKKETTIIILIGVYN
jgi:hypothetical protein